MPIETETTNEEKSCCSIPLHPASQIFPMMGESELRELANDILENGLQEPIVVYDGQVLDGRNRLSACKLVSVQPRFAEVSNIQSPIIYVLSHNLHRRHLTVSQRAAIGAEIVPMLREEAHKRQIAAGTANVTGKSVVITTDCKAGRSREIAAQSVGVHPDTIERANAIRNKNPEAFEKIKRGELTVNAAREGHTEKPRRGGSQPRSVDSKRGEVIAHSQKRKMTDGLSEIGGMCSGMQQLKLDMIVAVCTSDEIETWATKAETCASELRKFARDIRRQNGESTPSAK